MGFYSYNGNDTKTVLGKYFGVNDVNQTPNGIISAKAGSDCLKCASCLPGFGSAECIAWCCGPRWANASLVAAGVGDITFKRIMSTDAYAGIITNAIVDSINKVQASEINSNVFDSTVFFPIGTDLVSSKLNVNSTDAFNNVGYSFIFNSEQITSKWSDTKKLLYGYVAADQVPRIFTLRLTIYSKSVQGQVVNYDGGNISFYVGNKLMHTFQATDLETGSYDFIATKASPTISLFQTTVTADSSGDGYIATKTPIFDEKGIPLDIRCASPTKAWNGWITVEVLNASSGGCWGCDNCGGGAAKGCAGTLWTSCDPCPIGKVTDASNLTNLVAV